MKKREKSRDKFFTQMWKMVKGLRNVLKENKQCPNSRREKDGDEPATWRDDSGADNSEATDTDEDD
ncbi:hypothetical protein H5410_050921 [Solanum commersonii]|uniref:Uncharacterized protein n=1 Tax=Solanum commersonii TaxID=4109 RepID=A0A9J5WZ81_SOLCO|nr:hypothetical protein H5410_050921 [Solanum commersonii]